MGKRADNRGTFATIADTNNDVEIFRNFTWVNADTSNVFLHNKYKGGLFIIQKNDAVNTVLTFECVTTLNLSTVYLPIYTFTFAAVGNHIFKIYPGLAAVANVSINDLLPSAFRISLTTAGPTQFALTASLMV